MSSARGSQSEPRLAGLHDKIFLSSPPSCPLSNDVDMLDYESGSTNLSYSAGFADVADVVLDCLYTVSRRWR